MIPPREMMRVIIQLLVCSAVAYAAYPSSRVVYYLHTRPAAWASARDTCVKEGGRLLNVKNKNSLMADIDTLDRLMEWNGAYKSLKSDVWSGLHRFIDHTSGLDTFMWHRCEAFNATDPSNKRIVSGLRITDRYCASMDVNFELQARACDTKLPYICQVDEGQCWFLPFEDKSLAVNVSSTSKADLNTCARACRNDLKENNYECWGFAESDGTCRLYRDDGRHAFIRFTEKYLHEDPLVTSYVKICTGGEATGMDPVVEDNSVKPTQVNCTDNEGYNGSWDSSICYCDCDQPPIILDPEYLVLPEDEKVGRIVRDLKVNSKNTSANYRRLNSIDDSRPSAQSIGAAGIIILTLVFGSLALFDLNVILSLICRACCRKKTVATV